MKSKILIVEPFRDYEITPLNTDTLMVIQTHGHYSRYVATSCNFGTVIINDMQLRELCPLTIRFIIDCCTHTINSCPYAGDVQFQIFLAGKLEYESKFSVLENKLRDLLKTKTHQE